MMLKKKSIAIGLIGSISILGTIVGCNFEDKSTTTDNSMVLESQETTSDDKKEVAAANVSEENIIEEALDPELENNNQDDYQDAFSTFIHGGKLKKLIDSRFSQDSIDIDYNDIEGALYDINKDGIPELILIIRRMCLDTTNIAMYEFKDNQILELKNKAETSVGAGHWYKPYRDIENGDFYFYYNFRYYDHYYSYEKGKDLELVYHFNGELQFIEGDGLMYKEPGFDPSNLEEIEIVPIKSLDI